MVEKSKVINILDTIAPLKLAEPWDNCGLIVDAGDSFSNILVCLDVSNAVIEEAKLKQCDLIVSHHPAIFDKINRLSSDDVAYIAIKNGISLYAAHTNMDKAPDGLNQQLAADIGLNEIKGFGYDYLHTYSKIVVFCPKSDEDAVRAVFSDAGAGSIGKYSDYAYKTLGEGSFIPQSGADPTIGKIGETASVQEIRLETICSKAEAPHIIEAVKRAHSYEEPVIDVYELSYPNEAVAFGRIGKLTPPLSAIDFGKQLCKKLNMEGLRLSGNKEAEITTVAVACGAGSDLMAEAERNGADAFITGEVKHHQHIEALKLGITVYEAGHYDTEKQFVKMMQSRLQAAMNTLKSNVAVLMSDSEGCPYDVINK